DCMRGVCAVGSCDSEKLRACRTRSPRTRHRLDSPPSIAPPVLALGFLGRLGPDRLWSPRSAATARCAARELHDHRLGGYAVATGWHRNCPRVTPVSGLVPCLMHTMRGVANYRIWAPWRLPYVKDASKDAESECIFCAK